MPNSKSGVDGQHNKQIRPISGSWVNNEEIEVTRADDDNNITAPVPVHMNETHRRLQQGEGTPSNNGAIKRVDIVDNEWSDRAIKKDINEPRRSSVEELTRPKLVNSVFLSDHHLDISDTSEGVEERAGANNHDNDTACESGEMENVIDAVAAAYSNVYQPAKCKSVRSSKA